MIRHALPYTQPPFFPFSDSPHIHLPPESFTTLETHLFNAFSLQSSPLLLSDSSFHFRNSFIYSFSFWGLIERSAYRSFENACCPPFPCVFSPPGNLLPSFTLPLLSERYCLIQSAFLTRLVSLLPITFFPLYPG